MLLNGVAVSVMDSYYADLSAGTEMRELLVVFVVAFVLALLIHSLPNVIAGLVPGGGAAASSGSSLSAGALIGGAVSAGAAVASKSTLRPSASVGGEVTTPGGGSVGGPKRARKTAQAPVMAGARDAKGRFVSGASSVGVGGRGSAGGGRWRCGGAQGAVAA